MTDERWEQIKRACHYVTIASPRDPTAAMLIDCRREIERLRAENERLRQPPTGDTTHVNKKRKQD